MSFPFARVLTCCAALTCCGTTAMAESFAVTLGKTELGTLTLTRKGTSTTLLSTLNNTPLGVFDGTFTGTSKPAKAADGAKVLEFRGISTSSRKSRDVTVQIGAAKAVAATILPASEQTALSDVTTVPDGVMDPVRAVQALLDTTKGCPTPLTIYDGRRAIALKPTSSATTDTSLTCAITYQVIAGPGHLSPLKISKAKMQVTYSVTEGVQKVTDIRLGSGVFKLNLTRTD